MVSVSRATAGANCGFRKRLLSLRDPSKPTTTTLETDMLNKFRMAAEKAGVQATAFIKESSNKVANESRDFVQGFSLPGEAEKAAKILETFLGGSWVYLGTFSRGILMTRLGL